jgi:hypothetical protein
VRSCTTPKAPDLQGNCGKEETTRKRGAMVASAPIPMAAPAVAAMTELFDLRQPSCHTATTDHVDDARWGLL